MLLDNIKSISIEELTQCMYFLTKNNNYKILEYL